MPLKITHKCHCDSTTLKLRRTGPSQPALRSLGEVGTDFHFYYWIPSHSLRMTFEDFLHNYYTMLAL